MGPVRTYREGPFQRWGAAGRRLPGRQRNLQEDIICLCLTGNLISFHDVSDEFGKRNVELFISGHRDRFPSRKVVVEDLGHLPARYKAKAVAAFGHR